MTGMLAAPLQADKCRASTRHNFSYHFNHPIQHPLGLLAGVALH
jgi:hypothetical protein